MSAANVNKLLDIFSAFLQKHDDQPPFASCAELYNLINSTQVGDITWESFGVKYNGDQTDNPSPWMDDVYDVWMQDPEHAITDILGNADFTKLMDLMPYREYDTATDARRWQDFMSGDWAWDEAVSITSSENANMFANYYFYRTLLQKTPQTTVPPYYLLSLGRKRPLCQLPLGNMTTTCFTF